LVGLIPKVKMEMDFERKLVEKYKELLIVEDETEKIDDLVDIANIRDYFMFKTLDYLKGSKEKAVKFMDKLATFGDEFFMRGDNFNEGFFFTLSQLLFLKHEVGIKMIKRKYFDKSFKGTIKRLKNGES